ncbi:MAG TPA: ATP-binding protein, partial [Dehalococcoidia bacterium]
MERFPGLFVGRQAELNDLWQWCESGSGPLLVEGEPGIGRSRLVTEFAEMATRDGWSVRTGHCYEASTAVPLLPFVQLLSAPPGHKGRLDVEDELRGLSELDAVSPEIQASEQRLMFITRLAERIRSLSSSEKSLVVIEDIHWADPLSLLLVNHLADTP